jgi:hypothetical protein
MGNGLSTERYLELDCISKNIKYQKKYVSAFPDMLAYGQSIEEQSWGTYAWIADQPKHIVHYD